MDWFLHKKRNQLTKLASRIKENIVTNMTMNKSVSNMRYIRQCFGNEPNSPILLVQLISWHMREKPKSRKLARIHGWRGRIGSMIIYRRTRARHGRIHTCSSSRAGRAAPETSEELRWIMHATDGFLNLFFLLSRPPELRTTTRTIFSCG